MSVREGAKEDQESWRGFLRYLKHRGLRLFISDKCLGLVETLAEFYLATRIRKGTRAEAERA